MREGEWVDRGVTGSEEGRGGGGGGGERGGVWVEVVRVEGGRLEEGKEEKVMERKGESGVGTQK